MFIPVIRRLSANYGSASSLKAIKNMSNSNWETAKEKYLTMELGEKRALYRNYKTVKDIPTWETYFKSKDSLPDKIDTVGGFQIDASKNKHLAKKISIFTGDICSLEVDAIVNAANETLLGGGGVDGAIHRAAGKLLKEECRTLNGCPTGEAKITGAYTLPAKYVIHTVGPQHVKPQLLTACYKNCLDIALKEDFKSVAFSCISTGVYNYPPDKAAQIACREVRTFLEADTVQLDRIIFCLFNPANVAIYEGTLQSYFPVS